MMPRLKAPRLLPITIFVLAGLLAVKSAEMVRAAAAAVEHGRALTTTAQAATPASSERRAPAPGPGQPAAAATPEVDTAPVSDGERTVLLELRQRRQELDAREAALAAHESLLAATEQKLSGRVAELQVLQRKLEALQAASQERENAGWQGLVKLYEMMKPRDAATIFNDLEMSILLQVVDRMKELKAAPVLAAMLPDKARDVTARLAKMRTHRDGAAIATVGG
jgi:flagellar motility protein MotE (MotC chaperone)